MKNNKFIKFSLTVACAAVLAACGSSGGSNNAAAEEAAKQQAAEKAAEKAAAAEALVAKTKDVGAKFVKKTQSNLNVGEGVETNSKSSVSPTNMTVELHPSLDTIVVAIPLQGDAKQAYLEDFDFRGNEANTSGEHVLKHIYMNGTTKDTTRGRVDGESATKTASMGEKDVDGKAFVYEEGRLNYTRTEGKNVADTDHAARTNAALAKSVAEVYGHRTFVKGESETANPANDELNLANAPFTAKKDANDKYYTAGSKLDYVQYGRVTSKLHAVKEADLKDGKDVAQYGTKVASYGLYGQDGTEDNYFYRGVNNTPYSATLASDLKNIYFAPEAPAGKLHYQGHAVTYNLDKDYKIDAGLPNALGAEYKLISGTHVAADIDLASKNVTGNLYNVWEETNTQQQVKPHNVELANFNGTLANNGSISGSATKHDGAQGVLKASLYGAQAQELGGVISSNDTANNWGASFGAKVQNTPYQAPAVVTPPTVPAWGESTNQNNRK
ncbi:unnamed protein product [Haemophilus parainfluenzae T3T1]|uniref:Transferrin-binding protein B C-lobe/N-lobe beta-barrel domain-containing protein n=1 Tax=Haemophilus parainfluenzae (strain T3T1) TaxID=862965 RepID=A0AB33QGC2_HAEP3|nr:transferrin-binding protein-like solute binding protein [Haemophilus parainfluenzae]CBW14580.1 unnamed protein product [Haemophilus parainfluenzae T3T1]